MDSRNAHVHGAIGDPAAVISRPELLAPPIGTIVKLALAYALLALAFNRTTFSNTSRGLEVHHGPFPFPGRKKTFIPWTSIADVRAESRPRSSFTRFHSLVIVQRGAAPRTLLDFVPERNAVRLATVLREWTEAALDRSS
jgi:hypothetical protein